MPKSIGSTGALWLALVFGVVLTGSAILRFWPAPLDAFDAAISRAIASLRTPGLTSAIRGVHTIGSSGGVALLGLTVVAAAAWFRRWRHVLLFLISIVVVQFTTELLQVAAERPRPFDVTALASWEGYACPSAPVVALALIGVGAIYMLVVPGRARMRAKVALGVALAVVASVRIYLGVDGFIDAAFGVIVGVAIPVALFRAFAPSWLYPVHYGARGKAAHLDVTGRRGEAVRQAMQEQLGLTVLDTKPVGLEASGGSTPLRMTVVDEEGQERSMFAKLYARSSRRTSWCKAAGSS